MTIAMGFPYADGLLICADTQMSYPTGTKFVEHKIKVGESAECPCVFAFAGDLELATEIRSKIFRQIARFIKETQASPTTEELHAIVEDTTNEYRRLEVNLEIEFFLAVYPAAESPAIIHFAGRGVNVKTDEMVVLGCGNDSLTRYLVENLFSPDLDWYHALALGCYVVKKATQYTQGCGEPIEAVNLTSTGATEVKEKDITWADVTTLQQEVKLDKWLFKLI